MNTTTIQLPKLVDYDANTVTIGDTVVDIADRYSSTQLVLLVDTLASRALAYEMVQEELLRALWQLQHDTERSMDHLADGLHMGLVPNSADVARLAEQRRALAVELRHLVALVTEYHPERITTTTA